MAAASAYRRMFAWVRRRFSLSGWARLGITAGLFVIFASMVISIMETQQLGNAYEHVDAMRILQEDNATYRDALLREQGALDAYAHDALLDSAVLYVSAQDESKSVLPRFEADAARYGLTTEFTTVVAAVDVWQSWANNLKSTIDASGVPINDPKLLDEGDRLFGVALGADDRYRAAAQQYIDGALADARSRQDSLMRLSIVRGIGAALLLAGLGLFLSRLVLVPIARLASTARDLAAGKTTSIPFTLRSNEIGDLSRALSAWQASRHDRERLFDLSADLFSVAGAGYFKVLNATWEKVTGFTRAELMARPYLDRAHPDDRTTVTMYLDQIRKGATVAGFRARFACKDGSYRWLEWSVAPVVTEGLSYAVARDITDQVSAEQALRASGEQIRSILDNVADGIVTLDEQGRLQSVNPLVESLFGYSSTELIGQPVAMLIAAPEAEDFLRHLQTYLRPDKKQVRSGSHETVGRRKDGSVFPLEFLGSQMQTGDHRIFIGTLRDITERKTERENLEHRLLYDGLTGLPNRTLFIDRLRERIALSAVDGSPWGLLTMDMDRFKEVNDSLGHHKGDLLLAAVARRLSSALTPASGMGRTGGDEFAIYSASITDDASARTRAAEILRALEEPFTVTGKPIDVRASLGIALFPEHGRDLDTLMRHADVAMYLAKRRQTGVMLYTPGDEEESGANLGLRGELRHALNHDELFLEYMPIVDLEAGSLESMEALIRWQHRERGLIMPAQFIKAVEETELINPLTRWVLETALRQAASWRDRGLPAAISVNLSSVNLEDESLSLWLGGLLRQHHLEASCLILEITETSAMAKGAAEVLRQLDALGVRLSVDDFGTGYSSLAYLQRLPVDLIKIDRSFVSQMLTNPGSASIVRSIVDLAHNMSLRAVAEGVEDAATQALLDRLGCDYGQGFYIGRPMGPEAAARWMSGHLERAA